ncbi:MAG: acetylesterase, partial [Verrucomicrobiae bacterium]|nr:acetylesterase [Verrucomicrobiae bacterium]NNJ86924.1 acetylesterase [Akkermansiaceae bacterium]
YGMMNAPGVPLTTSLVLARKAGIKAPELDLAIERSVKLLRFYVGKGSIPYGDHAPWIENHDDNGKNGMAAVLFNLLDHTDGAEYFSRMSLACHGAERDTGHTGNFWNMTWAMPGVVQSGPNATGAWMKEFGAWYFDLARRWDGSFPHQGPPTMRGDATRNWDGTGAYLLAYAMPLKKIMLTGKEPTSVPQLSAAEAQSIIIDGRGWSNNNRHAAYDQLDVGHLFECLASWSPVVRERAAMALARRKGIDPQVPTLVGMLELPNIEARYGACRALAQLRGRAAPAVPALRKNLKHKDLWMRVHAAQTLAAIGDEAMVALPELLTMVAKGPSEEDPRAMEQRYLSFTLFNSRGGMLGRSLKGVDRDLLYKAIRAGLKNEDGRARGSYSSIYHQLSFEELKPLLPDIYRAIVEPAPSGIMFADQIRTAGLELFAKHHISEGIELTADYAKNMKPHASENRIVTVVNLLKSYGAHSQRAIPLLEDAIHYFENEEKDFPKRLSLQKAQTVRDAIKEIKASNKRPELISIKALL